MGKITVTLHYPSWAGFGQRNVATTYIEGTTFEEFKQNLLAFCKERGLRYVTPEVRSYFGDVMRREAAIPVGQLRPEDIAGYDDLGATNNRT